MRGADLLVKSLSAAGVTRIFALSGNQIMPIFDACLDAGIEITHTRHEASAVHMAEAYAQLTGKAGVALVTAGAGVANTLASLLTSFESETPVLLLSGDSPLSQDGSGAFQELDQISMTRPVTKLAFRAKAPAALGGDAARAVRTARSGKQGPVHIALPFDVVTGDASAGTVPEPTAFEPEAIGPAAGDAAQALKALSGAQTPMIVLGPSLNATRAPGLAEALGDAVDAPVIAMESPRGLNDPSLGAIAQVLAKADLIVALGKRIDFTLGFGKAGAIPPETRWIAVNADDGELKRARRNLDNRISLAVKADPRAFAKELMTAGEAAAARREWRSEAARLIAWRSYEEDAPSANGKITPAQLCAAVQRFVSDDGDTVLVCDGGEFGQWAQAVTKADARIINGVSGAIGGGLSYAFGAKTAREGATVIALMGDGTVGFQFAEFETAAREGTPFVVVIGNDRRWNAEYQIQLRDYGPNRLTGCELSDARYDLAAAALGAHGEYVTEASELDAALSRALKSGKAACVNVMIEGLPAPSGAGH